MIDIDKTARDLPGVCLHGHVPTATTMALAARVVELLDEAESIAVADRYARRLEDKCDAQTRKIRGLEKRIADALARANGRFCEWGERAEMVEAILRGGEES